jgi:hypothetical protein
MPDDAPVTTAVRSVAGVGSGMGRIVGRSP